MGSTNNTQPQGERLKKAVKWISSSTLECPDKKRGIILREAQLRFDLTPAECEFIDSNFG